MKVLLFLFTFALFNSCTYINCLEGQGPVQTKSFPQSAFSKFSLDISADVELVPSTKNELEITTYENIFDRLEIENRSEELEIDAEGCLDLDSRTRIRLYFVKLEELVIMGSGNVKSAGTIKGEKFEINIQGSGDADLTLETRETEASIMGSGDMVLRGVTESADLSINGSGNLKAGGLQSKKTKVSINGSGDAMLGSCNNLTSSVNGSGNVECSEKNNPDPVKP